MALSIIAQPAAIALTRNPVGIRLQTDNYLTTAGVKYQKVFEVTGACTANQTIIFAWNGKTVTLTCKASPDNAGNQFKENAAADPLNTWFNTYVIPAWRSNYDLNEDFNIVVIDSGVSSCHFYIQARNTGAAYNLTITNSLSNFAYIDPYGGHSAVTGVTEVTRSNFKIYCDVYLEDTWNSGTFSRIITLQGLPDDSLQADFQIQNALRAYLTADVPSFSQATITQCATILKKYYFTYAEAFGDPIAVQKVYNGEHTSLLALYAGLLSSAFPGNTFIADYTTAAS